MAELTEQEYEKLVAEFGPTGAAWEMFGRWHDENDPEGHLTGLEATDLYYWCRGEPLADCLKEQGEKHG
jgi:hypothetical protein